MDTGAQKYPAVGFSETVFFDDYFFLETTLFAVSQTHGQLFPRNGSSLALSRYQECRRFSAELQQGDCRPTMQPQ